MSRLKNLLQSDASNYIHLAILILLFYISRTSYLGYILLIPEIIFVFRKSKNILIYALFIVLILLIRFAMVDNQTGNNVYPLEGIIQDVNEKYFILKSNQKLLCYYDNTNELEPGMMVKLDGYDLTINTYNIPHVFDYEIYLKTMGIQQTISVRSLEIKEQKFSINIIKYKLISYIDDTYNQKTASYLKLFVLGENDNNNLDRESTSNLGISHIFAVSGMHIGLIAGFLLMILKKTNITVETSQIILVIFLIIYNIMTGFKFSILRASLLMTGIFLKDMVNIVLTKTDLISFSFILMLIINPYSFYSIGFQLSYLISVSIILGQYMFKGDSISSLIKVTLLATLIGLPITLEINHSFGLIFVFSNVFFVLYVTYLILPLSFLVVMFSPLSAVYDFIIRVFEIAIMTFEKINTVITYNFPTGIYKLMYWLIIILMLRNLKNVKTILILSASLIILILMSITQNHLTNRFIRFLDVNQGDAIHIHDQDCDMLIDTGKSDSHDQLIDYLEGSNTYEIDILVITHLHDDHYGEVMDILSNINIKTIYVNQSFLNIEKEHVIEEGFCFSCGKSKFQVIHDYIGDENENNNSLVLYALIGNIRFLLSGDIESFAEKEIVDSYNLEADILKVAHHGSNTSSGIVFLEAINPDIAVISVGDNNTYGLPDKEVLNRLRENRIDIFRTDEAGTITFYDLPFTDAMIIESYNIKKQRKYIIWNL